MKRLLSLLIVLISIFTFSVKAEEIVSIENLTCTSISKREASEVNVQVSGTTITTSDITFRNIRDNITCTFDVKNNSNKDIITIDEEAINNKSNENITYEVTSNDTSFIKALGTKTYQLKITYIKEYEEEKTIDNDLTITYKINKVLNPKTGINYIIQIVLAVIVIAGMYLLIRSKNKTVYKGFVFILGLVLTIPLIVNATESNTIKVNSKIKVEDRGEATLVKNNDKRMAMSILNPGSKITKIIFLDYVDVPEGVTTYDLSVEGDNAIVTYLLPDEEDNTYNYLYIASEHRIYGNEDMTDWFSYVNTFMYTYEIVDFVLYRSDRVKDYSYTFSNFGQNATKPINLDFTTQTMDNVETMNSMFLFLGRYSVGGTINFEKVSFDKNETILQLFSKAFYNATGDVKINMNDCNVSKIKKFSSAFFAFGDSFTGNIEIDLKNWDLSGIEDSGVYSSGIYEFFGQLGINAQYNNIKIDISNWNTSKVKSFEGAFESIGYSGRNTTIDSLIEIKASNLNFSSATDVSFLLKGIGYGCKGTVKIIANNWDFSKNTTIDTLSEVFSKIGEYSNNTYIEMKNLDIRNVGVTKWLMYYNGSHSNNLQIDLRGWNVSSLTSIEDMFGYCTAYSSSDAKLLINMNNWVGTDNIINAAGTFRDIMYGTGTKAIYVNTLDFTRLTTHNGVLYAFTNDSKLLNSNFKIYVKDEESQDFIMALPNNGDKVESYVKNEHILIYNGEAD